MCTVPKSEESVCISGALQDDVPLGTIAHLLHFEDCFLGSNRLGEGTHLETEVWEEPPPASWGMMVGNVRPQSFAGTPFCQLSIKRETIGHCQLDPMNLSVRCHSSFPLYSNFLADFSSSAISASLVPIHFHLQLVLPLAVHHNYIPQDPLVRHQPGEAVIACPCAGEKRVRVTAKAKSLDSSATKTGRRVTREGG